MSILILPFVVSVCRATATKRQSWSRQSNSMATWTSWKCSCGTSGKTSSVKSHFFSTYWRMSLYYLSYLYSCMFYSHYFNTPRYVSGYGLLEVISAPFASEASYRGPALSSTVHVLVKHGIIATDRFSQFVWLFYILFPIDAFLRQRRI